MTARPTTESDARREAKNKWALAYLKTEAGKEAALRKKRRMQKEAPAFLNAIGRVRHALARGDLVKMPCMICGSSAKVHAHHDNYQRPLDIVWLCPKHHSERHKFLAPAKERGAATPLPLSSRKRARENTPIQHGTLLAYQRFKCRCELCKARKMAERREYKKRKSERALLS